MMKFQKISILHPAPPPPPHTGGNENSEWRGVQNLGGKFHRSGGWGLLPEVFLGGQSKIVINKQQLLC